MTCKKRRMSKLALFQANSCKYPVNKNIQWQETQIIIVCLSAFSADKKKVSFLVGRLEWSFISGPSKLMSPKKVAWRGLEGGVDNRPSTN